MTFRQVADGAMDSQIAKESTYLKAHFTDKFWLTIHHEPEDNVNATPGSGNTAADYRAMFQHVVTQFRANNVHNAVFTIVYTGYSGWISKPWFKDLYPGGSYVDWVGYDPYARVKTSRGSRRWPTTTTTTRRACPAAVTRASTRRRPT